MTSKVTRTSTMYQPMKLPRYTEKEDRRKNKDTSNEPESQDKESTENKSDENRKNKSKQSREVNKVSKLVNWKLEYYFDELKKEMCFDVNGRYRTTARLQKYDLLYKVTEATKVEKNGTGSSEERGTGGERRESTSEKGRSHKKKNHTKEGHVADKDTTKTRVKKERKRKDKPEDSHIKPRLMPSARLVTSSAEAKRIISNANDAWDGEKIKKLIKLHRYLPNGHVTEEIDSGKVLTYSRHPAIVLHADYYVQHCAANGLHTGNPKNNPRLLKLRKRSKESVDNVSSARCSQKSSEQSDSRPHTPGLQHENSGQEIKRPHRGQSVHKTRTSRPSQKKVEQKANKNVSRSQGSKRSNKVPNAQSTINENLGVKDKGPRKVKTTGVKMKTGKI